jgi:hypothetical protein
VFKSGQSIFFTGINNPLLVFFGEFVLYNYARNKQFDIFVWQYVKKGKNKDDNKLVTKYVSYHKD